MERWKNPGDLHLNWELFVTKILLYIPWPAREKSNIGMPFHLCTSVNCILSTSWNSSSTNWYEPQEKQDNSWYSEKFHLWLALNCLLSSMLLQYYFQWHAMIHHYLMQRIVHVSLTQANSWGQILEENFTVVQLLLNMYNSHNRSVQFL